jgi:hypothetical protein
MNSSASPCPNFLICWTDLSFCRGNRRNGKFKNKNDTGLVLSNPSVSCKMYLRNAFLGIHERNYHERNAPGVQRSEARHTAEPATADAEQPSEACRQAERATEVAVAA